MSDDEGSDYKVGYKHPPRNKRFKKGESGNPKGRKLASKNTSSILMDELDKKIEIREGNRPRVVSKREALMTSLVNNAIAGKPVALRLLLKILEVGSPPEPFEPNTHDEDLLLRMIDREKDKGNEPSQRA